MTTGQDQTQTLYDAAARTRAAVTDPRFAADVDEAIEYFGPDIASHVGRYDTGELFVPLQVWLGKWEPGASLVLQDRAILVWGRAEVQHQIIPRKRPGGVAEVDAQADAVTLWIDCDNSLNVRVRRYAGTIDLPTTSATCWRRRSCRRRWSSAPTASARSPRARTSARTAAAIWASRSARRSG
jgi:hypothetical protein